MRSKSLWGLLGSAVVLCFALASVSAAPATTPRPKFEEAYIHNSPGGIIDHFIRIRDDFVRDGTRVHISGYCASACTLFLSVPNACVYKNTRLGFHAPFVSVGGIPIRIYIDSMTKEFLQQYPKAIQDWIKSKGGLKPDLIWLEGEEMLNLIPLCKGRAPVA